MPEAIGHVSDTAFWVAWHRGQEGRRRHALFDDPLATKLAGKHGESIARRMGIPRAMAWSMALRTHILDRFLLEAIAGGADMIVNLGAGLDTRPYRLDLPAGLHWVEVDFAHVIDYKTETLRDDKPVCRLERIACDLGDNLARRALLDRLNAQAAKCVVLTEGVVPYLTNADVAALADDLHREANIQTWLTDYYSPFFRSLSARGKIMRQLASHAPFRFDAGPDADDWPRFFAGHGWEIDAVRYTGDEGRRLGRDLPVSWIMRPFLRFVPEERLQPYRRMTGFVRLKRGDTVQPI